MAKKFKFKSEKPKEKIKLFGEKEQTVSATRIELSSNKEFLLEGCQGVLEYGNTYIKLKLQKGNVILSGTNFDIVAFEGTLIIIKGNISSLEFSV